MNIGEQLKAARGPMPLYPSTLATILPLDFRDLIKISALSDRVIKDVRFLKVVRFTCAQAGRGGGGLNNAKGK